MRKKLILIGSLVLLLAVIGAVALLAPKRQKGKAETTPHTPNFSHIKTAQFIYTATEVDLPWIATHYDWVGLDNPELVQPFRSYSSAPTWAYLLYHSVEARENPWKVTDYEWLRNWAKTNGKNWENMFDHFSSNTIHRPRYESSSSDSSTEQQFPSIFTYDGATFTDRTQNAADPTQAAFPIGNTNSTILYIGYGEPFKEANFTLQTPASGWAGTWEYWNGTSWTALNPTDGTANMTKAGKVEKAPPPLSSWQRTTVNGKERWWWRLRTTSTGTTPPIVAAGGLTGRNYIIFSSGLYSQPGWSSVNDPDGDGFAEKVYQGTPINPNATALFRYEARACYYSFTSYYLNIGATDTRAGVAALAKDYSTRDLGGGYHFDSLFFDNGHSTIIFDNLQSGGATIEDTSNAAWASNGVAILQGIKTAVGPGVIVFLGTGIDSVAESFVDAIDGWHGEGIIDAAGTFPKERLDTIIRRDAKGKWAHIHAARVDVPDGSGDWNRGKIMSLALYYLAAGNYTHYQWAQDNYSTGRFIDNWYKAIEYNVGQPKTSYNILHQEDDPSCPHAVGIAYMYGREFDNALVVAVPLPDWDSNYTASYTASLPNYSLPGGGTSNRYQKLNSDGTIDPNIITSITLRNAEGAILIKTDVAQGLTLAKSADKTQIKSGDTITYTIQYSASQQANNAKIEDPIPTGTTYQSGGTYDSVNNKVYWNLGNLSPGTNGSVSFQVKAS